ncbi:hypothetical protein Ctha_1167 [Chloroherpeton thalassium ATCC 35110]|uniref:Uncharacterized protein n=1 Tax=Chloroherpeton thalassium (strain ATCC 35110 / GB-78) TaxID=517418 RepID=B3QYK3_CHLT3|nr:hypothetical protein [Chloroherpeton thalassium]ACF13631.1 hypothetical protein Ctha_1167 [Chloroherpeton thalassium ATCC 35110]
MDERTSRMLLIIVGVYIFSQILLLITLGKDLEIIVLSFGIFIASVVAAFALPGTVAQRISLESVSMRRAKESEERQEELRRSGYEIDDEFLKTKGFGKSKSHAAKPSVTAAGRQAETVSAEASISALEDAILSNAAFFGGLEKMHEASKQMDDKTIESLAVKMGYQEISANEVRRVIVQLHESKSTEKSKSSSSSNQAERAPKTGLATSLDNSNFNDYIRRSMLAEQDGASGGFGGPFLDASAKRQSEPPKTSASAIPAQVVKRMRGIRASSGGKMKCENCMNHDAGRSFCMNASIIVEKTEVCDAWKPRESMG